MATAVPAARTADVEHHDVVVRGVRLHVVTLGSGPPLLLLHGWPETWYAWRYVMPLLADRFSLVAPDLRGTGDSDRPPEGYDLSSRVTDLVGVLDQLGLERVGVVGHDVGAGTAYALASEQPARVSALAVVDVPLPGFGLEEFDARLGLWHHALVAHRALAAKMFAGAEREVLSYFLGRTTAPERLTAADRAEYERTYLQPGAMVASLRLMEGLFGEDREQVARYAQRPLEMPVLALGGEHAGGTAPLACYGALARRVEGGIVPGAAHWVPEERPDVLAAEFRRFFAVRD